MTVKRGSTVYIVMTNIHSVFSVCRNDGDGWVAENVETEHVEASNDSVTVNCLTSHLSCFACLVNVGENMVGGIAKASYTEIHHRMLIKFIDRKFQSYYNIK